MKLLLGSQSPRRKELLAGLGCTFECRTADTEETYPDSLQGEEIPIYLSRLKADALRNTLHDDELLITADTIVWHKDEVLGKPHDAEDAIRMLRSLSGETHKVITGVTLTSWQKQSSCASMTEVRFSQLTEEEINYYVKRFMPLDKAGAYGIQEWIGFIGVEHINGSYFNVMGLPVQRLYQELKKWGVQPGTFEK